MCSMFIRGKVCLNWRHKRGRRSHPQNIFIYFLNHTSYFDNLYIILKGFTYFTKMDTLVTFSWPFDLSKLEVPVTYFDKALFNGF